MEFVPYFVPTNFCCLIVSKTKNDLAILQQETERLSVLEEECNKKLDQFYASKQEFEFMLRNLPNKILGSEVCIDDCIHEKEIIDEFTDYVTSVWQFGADKLGQAQKKIHYTSIVDGLPLSVYIQALQNSVEKGSMSIAQNVCHPYCSSLFYSMYTEITGDLIVRLSAADICFRQYQYLKKSLPFLKKLKEFIKTYTNKEKLYSIKLFSDEIISGINLKLLGDENLDDKRNLGAFRNVVNLLTGELLGYEDILDPHSEISPVVTDIYHQKPSKKIIVRRIVEFFLKDDVDVINLINNEKYNRCNGSNNDNINNNGRMNSVIIEQPVMPYVNSNETSLIDVNGTIYQIQNLPAGTLLDATGANTTIYDPYFQTTGTTGNCFNQSSSTSSLAFLSYDFNNCSPKPVNKCSTPGRRGRKPNSVLASENSHDGNCDLKPIKIPKLKQDLIKPLT